MSGKVAVRRATASRLIEASSRIAVCGQPPVSTPRMRLRQRRVLHQELRVFGGVDVVGHHAEAVLVAQRQAQGQGQCGLAGADRASDADAQGGTSVHVNSLSFMIGKVSNTAFRGGSTPAPGRERKLLQRSSGSSSACCTTAGRRPTQSQQDALPGSLAERHRLERRHHLVFAPGPQISGQRIGDRDFPGGSGQRPADRERDFGERVEDLAARNRPARAAGDAANSPSARSRHAARRTRGWPGSRR
jgi:hypothetical protein